ncbi:MAG: hypothetical protein N3A61_03140, partial [Ignavibacteria bacterium]|nr:hypothetical protein [Ignavibacteria bacterium]
KLLKLFFLVFCLILFSQSNSFSQNILLNAGDTRNSGFEQLNPYYTSSNPAFIKLDKQDELLHIKSSYFNSKGKFKMFIDPMEDQVFQINFAGKKTIDTNQIFKGKFSFQRIERLNWAWLVTKNYNSGNPFLLADSTVGKTHYNGILTSVEYGYSFSSNFSLGAIFNYLVDEGLKEVSPRPTSNHRDMSLKLGFGYFLNENLAIGLTSSFYDSHEKINYKEDEGAIYQETILLKFRGLDYPFVIRKKTETRYSYQNGYNVGCDIYFVSKNFILAGNATLGIDQLIVKDDPLDPKSEGYWRNNFIDISIHSGLNLFNDFALQLKYNFRQNDMWARHPNYSVLMFKQKIPRNFFGSLLKYKISNNIFLGAGVGIELSQIKGNDFYSDISWNSNGNKISSVLTCDVIWSDYFISRLSYGFSNFTTKENELLKSNSSNFFNDFRIADLIYYQTNYTQHSFQLVTEFPLFTIGQLVLYLNYDHQIPKNKQNYANANRKIFNAIIEYKIKVY